MNEKYKNIRVDRSNDLIIVVVKCSDRIVFKNTCKIGDKKAIRRMLSILELKGFIDFGGSNGEKGWF